MVDSLSDLQNVKDFRGNRHYLLGKIEWRH